MTPDQKITAAARAVLGTDSPLLPAVVAALESDLISAKEAASDSAETKWLGNLGVSAVVAVLGSVSRPRKERKSRKPKAELPGGIVATSLALPVAPTERLTFANGAI